MYCNKWMKAVRCFRVDVSSHLNGVISSLRGFCDSGVHSIYKTEMPIVKAVLSVLNLQCTEVF